MKRLLRAALLVLAVVLLLLGAGVLWLRRVPRHTPAGQPPLSDVSLVAFREAFNQTGVPRLLVLLSPT